ncbi:MAG TPA: Na+/H+ antiporter subunit G [Steroidobacteraceae bacterium]|nr:Na+/H+ antiporter subunit G [Steroidobacteraceae bacterium]
MFVDLLVALLILVSALFSFTGSVGLARLPDFFMRLHGPSKSTTLGVGGMLLASLVYFSVRDGLSLHELLIAGFLFVAAPVSAHLLSCAAVKRQVPSDAEVPRKLAESVDRQFGRRDGPEEQ